MLPITTAESEEQAVTAQDEIHPKENFSFTTSHDGPFWYEHVIVSDVFRDIARNDGGHWEQAELCRGVLVKHAIKKKTVH